MRIEDLALIGDTQTIALVGLDGTMHWLCLPRFDSGACFASLIGGREHGCWRIAPTARVARVERRYHENSLVLETDFHLPHGGGVRVIDAMPVRRETPDVVRIVEGLSGSVEIEIDLRLRFDYGRSVPWVRLIDGRLHAIAGPNAVVVTSPAPLGTSSTKLTIREGDRLPFVLARYPSHRSAPASVDPFASIERTDAAWRSWARRCSARGRWKSDIVRSLLTLKALTFAPSGGIVAAGTTSLPEAIGGERNWDYRYCWLRDAAFTLYAMLEAGYREEAEAWRDWLLRAVAGDPAQLQIMYGVAGERDLVERTLPWLPGYEGSRPVRAGNAAVGQLQLDVYGEVLDTLHQARRIGVDGHGESWPVERAIAEWLEGNWRKPGRGFWETRGERRVFTFSRVMAWVAFDRVVKAVERQGCDGPIDRWRRVRAEIHEDVCRHGFDADLGSFTQSYGSKLLDASLLLVPSVGFLPPHDSRVQGTIAAIERVLMDGGLVRRYATGDGLNDDGLHGREGAFIACSFWLVDALVLSGRYADARRLFERLLSIRNDVGLLSEQYDPYARRMLGNFPQAFSHVALVDSAQNLTNAHGPARERRET